jgi:hypothetical protein
MITPHRCRSIPIPVTKPKLRCKRQPQQLAARLFRIIEGLIWGYLMEFILEGTRPALSRRYCSVSGEMCCQ